ncbi:hypothetical protein WISP_92158 [Willisornis vidua]|uniref:Uncharacterized protein n=1 Tax=Willisornis vidua TaxID=1566151 RepID=A0ABQ9D653_9PASS|nr:hypothetical protein WISP_92158 [Willisornis vidua]
MDQILGDASLFLRALRKMVSVFPCCPGPPLTSFFVYAAVWMFAVVEKQSDKKPFCAQSSWCNVFRSVLCSDLLLSASEAQPISSVSCELLIWSVGILCMNVPSMYQAGGLAMEHPDVGAFPPKSGQRKAADALLLYTAAQS